MGELLNFKKNSHYMVDSARRANTVGKKIREARKEAGLTLSELAQQIQEYGVTVQTPAVNKWESGESIPNAYQLIAICHVLHIRDGLEYFTGLIQPTDDGLNTEGRRMLKRYEEYLKTDARYTTRKKRITKKKVKTSVLPASAGYGIMLDDEEFEIVEYPSIIVPEGTDFAVRVNGDSMEPAYHNGQIVFIEKCNHLDVGEVGLFIYNDEGYIKVYSEQEPDKDDIEEFTDAYGYVHPQIYLLSYNKAKYKPMKIKDDITICGRVLN